LISSRSQTEVGAAEGPAVLEVVTGKGISTIDNRQLQLVAGHMGALVAGQKLQIENDSPYALMLRLYVFKAK
jgi:hypothetical protein